MRNLTISIFMAVLGLAVTTGCNSEEKAAQAQKEADEAKAEAAEAQAEAAAAQAEAEATAKKEAFEKTRTDVHTELKKGLEATERKLESLKSEVDQAKANVKKNADAAYAEVKTRHEAAEAELEKVGNATEAEFESAKIAGKNALAALDKGVENLEASLK